MHTAFSGWKGYLKHTHTHTHTEQSLPMGAFPCLLLHLWISALLKSTWAFLFIKEFTTEREIASRTEGCNNQQRFQTHRHRRTLPPRLYIKLTPLASTFQPWTTNILQMTTLRKEEKATDEMKLILFSRATYRTTVSYEIGNEN